MKYFVATFIHLVVYPALLWLPSLLVIPAASRLRSRAEKRGERQRPDDARLGGRDSRAGGERVHAALDLGRARRAVEVPPGTRVASQPRVRALLQAVRARGAQLALGHAEVLVERAHRAQVARARPRARREPAFGARLAVRGEQRALLSDEGSGCLLYTSPSPRDQRGSRMPSSA